MGGERAVEVGFQRRDEAGLPGGDSCQDGFLRALDQFVLCQKMRLSAQNFVQRGFAIVERGQGLPVSGGGLHVLPDHDHGQQHQLQEGLRHPGDDRCRAAPDSGRK